LRHKGTNKKWISPTNLIEKCIILHKIADYVQGKFENKDDMTKVRIAILASGSGSNAENIVRFFSTEPNVEIACILSNKSEAKVHERALRLGIPSQTFSRDLLENGEEFARFLREANIDFVVLAGYLLKIPSQVINQYPERIVNIHPALLPKFGGKGMYGAHVHQAVVDAGETESGITVHLVNSNYDEGSILFQAKCAVLTEDGPDDVAAKVHQLEYEFYPKVIADVLKKMFFS
jgi:phosphoribosylglycinamide formyltransferase-1